MTRSLKKGPYVDEKLIEKVSKAKPGDIIKTWARSSVITPEMIGLTFAVHNGKAFISVKASEDMVGHKLGEFSQTTKFVRHGGKMQRELEAAKTTTAAVPAAAPAAAAPAKGPAKGKK